MFNLKIISSTVRPGRMGPIVSKWVAERARLNENFLTEVLDLGEINLPMMDEPDHPAKRMYQHDHTKNWSAKIEQADAFIFVTAEYDHNYPAPLRNALEYLVHEWKYKPAGIVSYGGVSAGTRAMKSLQGDLASLGIFTLMEAVNFPFFSQHINERSEFEANDISHEAMRNMLTQLVRCTKGMKMIREDKTS